MAAMIWRVALVAVLAVSAVACGDDGDQGATDTESTSDGTGSGDPVRLGALLELSGPGAPFGESSLNALEIAVDRLNEAGGVTIDGVSHEFELVVVDNETDASAGVAGAQQLLVDEGVDIVIGPVFSSVAPGISQTVTSQGGLLISDAPNLHALIEGDLVDSPPGSRIFRSLFPPLTQAYITAKGIVELFPDVERVAMVVPDDAGGAGLSIAGIPDALTELGVEVVAQEAVPPTATDFQTVLTGIRERNPDLLFFCCTPGTISGLMRQSVELGIDAPFVYLGASMSLALEEAIGEQVPVDAAVVYTPSALELLPSGEILTGKPEAAELAAELDASGVTIDSATAIGMGQFFDTIALLAAAMEQAGTVDDVDAIAAALEEVTVEGVNGTIGFGPGHAWEPAADVCVARAGNPVPECVLIQPPG